MVPGGTVATAAACRSMNGSRTAIPAARPSARQAGGTRLWFRPRARGPSRHPRRARAAGAARGARARRLACLGHSERGARWRAAGTSSAIALTGLVAASRSAPDSAGGRGGGAGRSSPSLAWRFARRSLTLAFRALLALRSSPFGGRSRVRGGCPTLGARRVALADALRAALVRRGSWRGARAPRGLALASAARGRAAAPRDTVALVLVASPASPSSASRPIVVCPRPRPHNRRRWLAALLLEAGAVFAEHAEIMVRELEIIFGVDAIALHLRVARQRLVFFEQLGGVAALRDCPGGCPDRGLFGARPPPPPRPRRRPP